MGGDLLLRWEAGVPPDLVRRLGLGRGELLPLGRPHVEGLRLGLLLQLGLKLPVGVFERPDGPPAYTLHPDADVTVLVFTKERVTANVATKKLTADEIGSVVRAVGECK